jgi:hypothetical protein
MIDDLPHMLSMAIMMHDEGIAQWAAASRQAELIEGNARYKINSTATRLDGKFRKRATQYRYHGKLAVVVRRLNDRTLSPNLVLATPRARHFLDELHQRSDLTAADKDRLQADLWDHLSGKAVHKFIDLPAGSTQKGAEAPVVFGDILPALDDMLTRL